MNKNEIFAVLREHSKTIVGAVLIACGVFLMNLTREIFFYVIVFSLGFFMVYYGLHILQFKRVVSFIDTLVGAIRKAISQD
jgi:sulfite exporter TauE/SafE